MSVMPTPKGGDRGWTEGAVMCTRCRFLILFSSCFPEPFNILQTARNPWERCEYIGPNIPDFR